MANEGSLEQQGKESEAIWLNRGEDGRGGEMENYDLKNVMEQSEWQMHL